LSGRRALPWGSLGRDILIKLYLIKIKETRKRYRIQEGNFLASDHLVDWGRDGKRYKMDIK
jgi:hypothetical protein